MTDGVTEGQHEPTGKHEPPEAPQGPEEPEEPETAAIVVSPQLADDPAEPKSGPG